MYTYSLRPGYYQQNVPRLAIGGHGKIYSIWRDGVPCLEIETDADSWNPFDAECFFQEYFCIGKGMEVYFIHLPQEGEMHPMGEEHPMGEVHPMEEVHSMGEGHSIEQGYLKSRQHSIEFKIVPCDMYFGYFYEHGDRLYIASDSRLRCFDSDCTLIWQTKEIAVDGVVVKEFSEDTVSVSCETDPPGGWVRHLISLRDGEIIA